MDSNAIMQFSSLLLYWCVAFVGMAIVCLKIYRFFDAYSKARAQFPGPPIKNIWVGNLDQTMADDLHEKVPTLPRSPARHHC